MNSFFIRLFCAETAILDQLQQFYLFRHFSFWLNVRLKMHFSLQHLLKIRLQRSSREQLTLPLPVFHHLHTFKAFPFLVTLFKHTQSAAMWNFAPATVVLSQNMSIIAEVPGFIQVFSDGSVKRFNPEIANVSAKTSNGYKSMDVTIDSSKPITARIFLPDVPESVGQLPVLVYFHGGGFCIGSTTWLGYHAFLGDLSVISKAIVLSIDYRLAPENKLPIAYEDCYGSLEWLSKNVDADPWLRRADLSRVFLSGDSAGGNIVHQVAIRAIKTELCNVRVKGLLIIHPYFGSDKRTQLEMADGSAGAVSTHDLFWKLSLPEGENRDYYGCNFENAELSAAEWSQFPEVVVFVAGLDFLNERGLMYAEFLQKKGVRKVKLIEAKDEPHVYHVYYPESEATSLLQKQMSDFIESLESHLT